MSRHIEIEPVTFICRLFAEGQGYWDEYEAVMTLQKMGPIGFVSALHGTITRADHDMLCEMLKEDYGLTEIRWLRKGGEQKMALV